MSDEVTKQGSITQTVSAGSKKDTVANKTGSQADPDVSKDYSLPPRRFQDTNYSKVGVTFGLTKSLGNFEFARIDVSAEDFCDPSKKKETWDELSKLASEYAFKAAADVDAYLTDKKSGKSKDKMGF